jgi:nucleoid-associated protein YgaU
MAVGGLLVGAVLAYAIFSGPKNKGTDQAGQVARDTNAAGTNNAGGDRATTPDTPTNNGTSAGNSGAANTGANGGMNGGVTKPPVSEIEINPPNRGAGGTPTGANGDGGRIGEIGGGTFAKMPEGKWNWEAILNEGAGKALLPPSETPGPEGTRLENPGGARDRGGIGSTTRPSWPDVFGPISPRGDGPKTYVVRAGETFWTIARDHYGNGGYWSHVARANSRIDPKTLKAGTVINLPARSEVVPAESARAASAAPVAKSIDATREYRVKSGDSLTVICKSLYGKTDPVTIGRLYEANRDLIGPNQNALKLGMVLSLPEPPTKVATVVN